MKMPEMFTLVGVFRSEIRLSPESPMLIKSRRKGKVKGVYIKARKQREKLPLSI